MIWHRQSVLVTFCMVFPVIAAAADPARPDFRSAHPVWLAGREVEMNLAVGFHAAIPLGTSQPATLKLACSTVYRAWLNGQFLAYGPAHGPHGHYRVEELSLQSHVRSGVNVLAIEVVGYNVNSYDTLDQPGFLQAEVLDEGGRVLASTAGEGTAFQAFPLGDRVQKVQRYSFQRPFIEVYRLSPGFDAWRRASQLEAAFHLEVLADKQLLPRRVPLPQFEIRSPVRHVARGTIERREEVDNLWKDRSLVNIGPKLKGYLESELEVVPSIELQHYTSERLEALDQPYRADEPVTVGAGAYRILDLGVNLSGMIGATLECSQPSRVWMAFDEILSDEDVDFKRLGCVNVVSFALQPGIYEVESLEPYTMRYLKLMCVEGQCRLHHVQLREYKHPPPRKASFQCSDTQLNRLFEAGVETFRQNTVDVFMDCPSRERAGWLCDSFFTSRVAHDLTGTTLVEKDFYENFLLPDRFRASARGHVAHVLSGGP